MLILRRFLTKCQVVQILFDANEFFGKCLLLWECNLFYGYYKVPTSSKYYSMPMSFLAGIGVTWCMRCRGVQMLILRRFLTKCQLVRNII